MIDIAGYVQKEAPLIGAVSFDVPGIEHLSASAVNQLRRCPEQFRVERLLKQKGAPGEARLTGSAVHMALERNFRQKLKTGEDLPVPELFDWFDSDEGFAYLVSHEETKAEALTIWDSSPDQARARGREMVGHYMLNVAPRIEPVNVEERFELDWKPLPIVGYIDVETRESVLDYKTTKQVRRKPKPDWVLQGAVYCCAVPRPVHFHVLSATPKTGRVEVTTPLEAEGLALWFNELEREAMRETVRIAANEIQMYWDLLGPDRPWPVYGRMSDWACGYCSFQSTCSAWAR